MKKVIIAMAVLAMAVPAMAAEIPDDDGGHSGAFGCGACHSAHVKVPIETSHAKISEALVVPLWGRTITTEALNAYGQGTGTAVPSLTYVTPGSPTNESALCMSCHDGVTNSTTGAAHKISSTDQADGLGYIDTSIGHPISFTYTGAVESANFNDGPIASGASTAVLENGRMECTSCHDIHGANLNSDNYAIRATSKQSAGVSEEAICKSCHKK